MEVEPGLRIYFKTKVMLFSQYFGDILMHIESSFLLQLTDFIEAK